MKTLRSDESVDSIIARCLAEDRRQRALVRTPVERANPPKLAEAIITALLAVANVVAWSVVLWMLA